MPLLTCISNPASCLLRLYVMSYFPSGFWPRFITRMLGDLDFYQRALDVYELPEVLRCNATFMRSADVTPTWQCWQTGVTLDYLGACLLRVKEVSRDDANAFCDYRKCRIQVEQQEMGQVNLTSTSVLEIMLPNEAVSASFEKLPPNGAAMTDSMCASVVIHPNQQVLAALLNLVVDHIDTLLEDWYPDMGARFVQNSRGMYLITRLVPCVRCLVIQSEIQSERLKSGDTWSMVDVNPHDNNPAVTRPILVQRHSNTPVLSDSGSTQDSSFSGSHEQQSTRGISNSISTDNAMSSMGDKRRGLYLEADDKQHDPGLNNIARKFVWL